MAAREKTRREMSAEKMGKREAWSRHVGPFDFLPRFPSLPALFVARRLPPASPLHHFFTNYERPSARDKAFTTRIQLTRKASRNITKRDSALTLMLPVENCKNCLRRFSFCFFLLNNSLYEGKLNPIHTARSSSRSSLALFRSPR